MGNLVKSGALETLHYRSHNAQGRDHVAGNVLKTLAELHARNLVHLLAGTRVWQTMAYVAVSALAHFQIVSLEHIFYTRSMAVLC